MRAKRDRPDNPLQRLAKDPIDRTEAKEPTLAIDSADPTEPMDSTEPVDPIDRIESREAMLICDRTVRRGIRAVCLVKLSAAIGMIDR